MGSNKHTGLMRGAKQRLHNFAPTIVVAGLTLACALGCARVSVENVKVRAVGLPRPQMIYVHDFAVSADAVALDRALGARALEMVKGTETEDRIKIAKEVARIVSENLVKEILAQGMPAQLAGTAPVSGPALSIDGQFLAVDEGNRLKRMVIGFGAGASEIRTLVQVYETTNEGQRLVEDFYTTVKVRANRAWGPWAASARPLRRRAAVSAC